MFLFATADSDFDSALDGLNVTFGTSGPEIQEFAVNITDDNFYEGAETFTAVIAISSNPELVRTSLNTTVVTISDDESELFEN